MATACNAMECWRKTRNRERRTLMQLWSVKTDWGSTCEPSMKNKLKLLMQSWSFRSVGHLKFGSRAHVNHQQEMLRTILMWPWTMGREILRTPRLWCLFVFVKVTLRRSLAANCRCTAAQQLVEAARWMYFYLSTKYLILSYLDFWVYSSNFSFFGVRKSLGQDHSWRMKQHKSSQCNFASVHTSSWRTHLKTHSE